MWISCFSSLILFFLESHHDSICIFLLWAMFLFAFSYCVMAVANLDDFSLVTFKCHNNIDFFKQVECGFLIRSGAEKIWGWGQVI